MGKLFVHVYSYTENGTLTVTVEYKYNSHVYLEFERNVFGVKPEVLTRLDF